MNNKQVTNETEQVNEFGEKIGGALKGMFSTNPIAGAKAGKLVEELLPIRQRIRRGMLGEQIYEFLCRGFLIIPTEEQLDEMDRKERR